MKQLITVTKVTKTARDAGHIVIGDAGIITIDMGEKVIFWEENRGFYDKKDAPVSLDQAYALVCATPKE